MKQESKYTNQYATIIKSIGVTVLLLPLYDSSLVSPFLLIFVSLRRSFLHHHDFIVLCSLLLFSSCLFFLFFISCFFFSFFFFFFNDTATTEIYTLSLHDALPI